jgi:hypothetical protein
MQTPNCKECKWFKECAVRKLCLPIEYCQYKEKENE